MQRYQREHFWNAIVWPLLWPLLLLQAALIVLCIAVGALVWWMSPSYTSWSTLLWLMMALLIGSSLNVGAFLMLVKARARRKDSLFMQELTELEQHSQTLCATVARSLPAHNDSPPDAVDESLLPLKRLARVNEVLAGLDRFISSSQDVTAATKNAHQEHEQTLLDDLQHHQRQLKHVIAGRERAREESRLKTSYLTLLQSETDSLLEHLNSMVENEITDIDRQNVTEVHERLTDIRALLANIVQQSSAEQLKSDRGSAPQRHLHVLVVDDGPVNLMLARQMLEAQGLKVEGVSSGEQALERQRSVVFDLVFMDIYMPTLDGLETTRQWRKYERAQGSSQSVLVALTANADNARREACLAAGMDDLLAKPYQPRDLVNMIACWFPDTIKATPTV
ncbi:response regulator [Halomonas sp. SpR8]|uniref:response regulator n=1 Tax=Halomonas sp. SpR8 TaxID=3050463 RepID=UPI0027E4271A|nr:response regulator [Halomonas sp. SpR8]MDQ7727253.1 response regulator [Halomonas sp. SpR8]